MQRGKRALLDERAPSEEDFDAEVCLWPCGASLNIIELYNELRRSIDPSPWHDHFVMRRRIYGKWKALILYMYNG